MHRRGHDRDRHAQEHDGARGRRAVGPEVEADDERDARRVHHRRAARHDAAPLQHHAPQHAEHDRQQEEHARHRGLLQAVLVALPREAQERAHDQAQRDRAQHDLRRRAPGRRHREHRKVHAEYLDAVRELVPEQRGREVVVPRRVRGQHETAPALRVRRVVHPHAAAQQRAARERHHAEHVVQHDRRAPRRQRQRQRRERGVAVRVHHRRLVHVPVHQRDRGRPVVLAEERVPEEDRVERDRQHADVHNHALAQDLLRAHPLEARTRAVAPLHHLQHVAADRGHLPAQAQQTQHERQHQHVLALELQFHAAAAPILKTLARILFYLNDLSLYSCQNTACSGKCRRLSFSAASNLPWRSSVAFS